MRVIFLIIGVILLSSGVKAQILPQSSIESYTDTLFIKNNKYYIFSTFSGIVKIMCPSDTIVKENLIAECTYPDFDGDGYKDIIISEAVTLNRYAKKYLFVFNNATACFNEIKGLEEYPQPERIGKNLYYSFKSAGCAGMNQMEQLFYIKNDSAIQVASAYIVGCEHDDMGKGNYIYSHINGKEKLVAKFGYNSDIGLLKYYKKNIRKFK